MRMAMIWRIAYLIVITAGMCGCMNLRTKEPLYTEKDRVEEPAVEGMWLLDMNNEGYEKVEVKRKEGGGYELKMLPLEKAEKDGTAYKRTAGAVLMRLGKHFVVQINDLGGEPQKKRAFFKVAMIDGRLFEATCGNGGNLKALLEKNADAKFEFDGEDGLFVCLLDTTEKMRALVEKNAADFFDTQFGLMRRVTGEKIVAGKLMQTKEQETFEVAWLLWTQTRMMCRGRDLLSRIVPEGLDEKGVADWLQRYQQELLPQLELKNCDEDVAKLYREIRATLAKVYQRGQKDEKIFVNAKDGQAGTKFEDVAADVKKDPIGFIGKWLAEGDEDRKKLEELGGRLLDVRKKLGVE